MKPTRLAASILAAALATAQPAIASPDHKDHDHKDHEGSGAHAGHDDKPRHGGIVRVVNDVNFELVVKPDSIAIYIADHGKPVDLKGATAKLTLLSTAGKTEANLTAEADRLAVKGGLAAPAGTKALATVNLQGKAPVSVRFTLK